MTDTKTETQEEKIPWTTPRLEPAGTIDDVAGGAQPGLDSNSLPAALSMNPVAVTHDLADELRLTPGPVPRTLADPVIERDGFVASQDAFILTGPGGLRFHYRRGAGVRCAAPLGLDPAAADAVHKGSVHGAAAWMNFYLPLHASAVAWRGGVHAFAGASGAGKSTLVAALARQGPSLFADDVLTVVISPGEAPMALPGHKRLRLWADALAMTGRRGRERVWPGVDKFFVDSRSVATAKPLPLASLTLLEDGDDIAVTPLSGARRLIGVRDSCYRPEYRLPDVRVPSFAQLADLAARVPLFRFARPRDPARFAQGVDCARAHLERIASE